MISRHVHYKYVTDAARCTQAAVARDNSRHQLVRVQTAFHQDLGLAFPDQLDGFRCGRVTMRYVHDRQVAEINSG